MAGRTRIQTAPRTGIQFDSAEITGFLQSIADAGGLAIPSSVEVFANFFDADTPPAGEIGIYIDGGGTSFTGGIFSVFDLDDEFINSGLGNYFLLYVDIQNWILFESATQLEDQHYATNIVAGIGSFTENAPISIYSSVTTGNYPGSINTSTGTQFETISGTNYSALIRDGGAVNYLLFPQGIGDRTWAAGDDVSFRLPNGEIYSGLEVSTIRVEGSESRFDSGSGDAVRVDFDQATVDAIQSAYSTSGATWFMDPDDLWFENVQVFNGDTFPTEEGIQIEDFIDFFDTTTPVDTEYPWPSGIGRTITDAEGDTEIIIGASLFAGGAGAPIFTFASNENDFELGDIIRVRIWPDDVDQETTEPALDVRKQILLAGSTDTGEFGNFGNDAVSNVFVITSSGIDTLLPLAIETIDHFSYFATDQVRVDRSSQVTAISPAQLVSDSFTIEPSNEVSLTANIKIVDNKNIGEVYGTISPSFEIPLTEEIKREFNYPDEVGNQIIPGVANSVDVILDNDEATIGIGTLSVEAWDDTSMDVRFQSGIPSLSDSLGEKLMSGVDLTNDELVNRGLTDASGLATGIWADLEFPYTMDNWVSAQFMTNFDAGYVPIFGDFGFDPDGRPRVPSGEVLELASVDYVSDNSTSYIDEFGVTTQAQHNYYVDLYGSNSGSNYTQQSPASAGSIGWGGTNRLIGPTPYFGEIAQGGRLQGYITHPSTPMRVDQTYYAPTLKTTLDKIALVGNYTYSFVGDNNQDILSTMLEDVVVFKKGNEGLGIILKPEEITDEFGFILQDAGEAGVEIDQGSRASNNPDEIHLQYMFGESGSVTQAFGSSSNISNNNYIVPVDGNYEFEFEGSFDVTAEDLRPPQYVDHEAIIFTGEPGTLLHSEWFDDLDDETNVYESGLRILSRVKIDRVKGEQTGNEDWTWKVMHSGNFVKGERIYAALISSAHKGNKSVTATIGPAVFRTTRTPLIWEGKTYNLGLQFGDTKAVDVLHSVIDRFNLVIVPDPDRRNHFNFFQYYDWILSAPRNYQDPDTLGFTPRVDWSDKIDTTSIQYTSLFNDQEEILNFSSEESDDRISKETQEAVGGKVYGSKEFTYESDQTDGDKTIGDGAQSLSVATLAVAGDISKTIQVDPINGIPHLYEFDGEEAKSIETGLIIGYSKKISLPRNFYFADGADSVRGWVGDVRTISNINDDESLDLNFSKNYAYSISDDTVTDAFTMYHEQRVDQLYDPRNRKLTAPFAFEPHEFREIVGNETIHLFGNDWLVNEISDFPLSDPGFASVELIGYLNNFTTVFTEMKNRFVEDPGELWTTLIGVEVRPYDVVDGAEVFLPAAIKQSEYSFDTIGTAETVDPDEPGGIDAASQISKDIVLTQATRYDFQGSSIRDNSADLTGVSVQYIDNADNTVTARITITTQAAHLYHKLLIEPEVNALPSNAVNATLTAEIGTWPQAVVATPTLTEFGIPGGTVTFRVQFNPERDSSGNDYELLTGAITDNSSSITGLASGTFTDQGTGILGVWNYTIPTDATSDIVISPNLLVSGTSQQLVGQTTASLTVSFSEQSAYSNVSLGRQPVIFPPGIPGDQFTYELPVNPDFGYYVLEGNWSSLPVALPGTTDPIISAGNSIQNGSSVILEYTMTYPPVGTGAQSVVVSGANAISDTIDPTTLVSRTITYNGSGDSHTTSEPEGSERFEGIANVVLQTGHNFTITPAEGTKFTAISQVNVTSSSGVSNIQKVIVGGSIVLKYDVDQVASGDLTGQISYTVNAQAEDWRVTVNVIDDITGLEVSKRSFSWGYDQSSSAQTLPEMSFTVKSNNPQRQFTSTGDIQAGNLGSDQETSATASLEVDSIDTTTGTLTCNIDVFIPANTAEDIVFTLPLRSGATLGGQPGLSPATTGEFIIDTYDLVQGGGLPSVGFTANGTVQGSVSGNALGTTSATFLASVSVSYGDDSSGKVGHNGAVLANGTGEVRTNYFLLHPLGDTSTILDAVAIRQATLVSAGEVVLMDTFPVAVGGTGDSVGNPSATGFQYTDQFGEVDTRFISSGQIALVCAVGGDGSLPNRGITILENTASVGPGTHTCDAGSAGSVGGFTVVTQPSGTPPASTPNTVITFIPTGP